MKCVIIGDQRIRHSERKEKKPSLPFLEIRKDHKAGDKLDELIKVE